MFKWIDSLSRSITRLLLRRCQGDLFQELDDWREVKKSLKSIRYEVRTIIPLVEEDERRKARKDHGSVL